MNPGPAAGVFRWASCGRLPSDLVPSIGRELIPWPGRTRPTGSGRHMRGRRPSCAPQTGAALFIKGGRRHTPEAEGGSSSPAPGIEPGAGPLGGSWRNAEADHFDEEGIGGGQRSRRWPGQDSDSHQLAVHFAANRATVSGHPPAMAMVRPDEIVGLVTGERDEDHAAPRTAKRAAAVR